MSIRWLIRLYCRFLRVGDPVWRPHNGLAGPDFPGPDFCCPRCGATRDRGEPFDCIYPVRLDT